MEHASDWESRFDRYLQPYLGAFRHKKRRQWAPLYLRGLLLPGERKSIEPLAARVAPGHEQEMRHFVSESQWDDAAVEAVLWEKANELLGGQDAVAIVDDTALPKKGEHSVGVAHQYCGALGKQANCQCLVSITLARDDIPIPVVLTLYLPKIWAHDPARRQAVGVPEDRGFRAKWQIALDELHRLRESGVIFGSVLADGGYGECPGFRAGLSEMGLVWAVGIPKHHGVFPASAHVRMPRPRPGPGRPRKHGIASHRPRSAAEAIASTPLRTVRWRKGTKGPLHGRFAARRVLLADPHSPPNRRLPGDEVWLVCEQRENERKYYVTNHSATAPLLTLVRAIKARWVCEQAHQQLKEELGLDHFEGRSWRGLHHHAQLTMIAFAFLQQERLRENKSQA